MFAHPVNVVGKGPHAIWQRHDFGARYPLGVIVKFLNDPLVCATAISFNQLAYSGISGPAGSNLGAHVAGQLIGNSSVLFHYFEEGLVRFAILIQPDGRDTQALLENFAGIDCS